MWPEAACRAVHLTVYRDLPGQAESLMTLAGAATADYILAHRIPGPVKALIRALPAPLGARFLTAAIARHAWTFAGSGRLSSPPGTPDGGDCRQPPCPRRRAALPLACSRLHPALPGAGLARRKC